ncbi:hypothetical protein BS47DRAFT_989111 [Hydnum rufescens UP504]|uniref:Secreted protein n=1 Tax=Hydnum rufescens UP504 TaxID=1448309 RepID=A0A9P6DWT6_9AGAM|nr:hypothetical protein BS47DRAFT_989111 [Hydnum rufescens UP504]
MSRHAGVLAMILAFLLDVLWEIRLQRQLLVATSQRRHTNPRASMMGSPLSPGEIDRSGFTRRRTQLHPESRRGDPGPDWNYNASAATESECVNEHPKFQKQKTKQNKKKGHRRPSAIPNVPPKSRMRILCSCYSE